jgi:hypothetical protein
MITVTRKANKSGNKNMKLIIARWCLRVGNKYNPMKNSRIPHTNMAPLNTFPVPAIDRPKPTIVSTIPAIRHIKDDAFLPIENVLISDPPFREAKVLLIDKRAGHVCPAPITSYY